MLSQFTDLIDFQWVYRNFRAPYGNLNLGTKEYVLRQNSVLSTSSVFGTSTSVHPDLVKLQREQGALNSYRKAQSNLEKLTLHRCPINNHTTIKLLTNVVGTAVAQENLKPLPVIKGASSVEEVIIQIDGGHIPIKEKDKRSFSALSAIAYRPENIRTVDKHHRQLEFKSCALSAKDDELVTMKTFTLNAARKQGMTKKTQVTALADGALNC